MFRQVSRWDRSDIWLKAIAPAKNSKSKIGFDAIRPAADSSLRRFSAPEAWGLLNVRDLTAAGVLAACDALKAAPGMANHVLSCGRALWNLVHPLEECRCQSIRTN